MNLFVTCFQKSSSYAADVDQWDDENNEIVRVAKDMSNKLSDMAQFARNQGLQPAGSIQVRARHVSRCSLPLVHKDCIQYVT